jgi:hypothetical protein
MSDLRTVNGSEVDLADKLRQRSEDRGWLPRDPADVLPPYGCKTCPSCKKWCKYRSFKRQIPDPISGNKGYRDTYTCTPCRQAKNRQIRGDRTTKDLVRCTM